MAHADVPEIDAFFLDGYDDKANPMGSKGLGELGICGSGAAVANAVYDATSARAKLPDNCRSASRSDVQHGSLIGHRWQ